MKSSYENFENEMAPGEGCYRSPKRDEDSDSNESSKHKKNWKTRWKSIEPEALVDTLEITYSCLRIRKPNDTWWRSLSIVASAAPTSIRPEKPTQCQDKELKTRESQPLAFALAETDFKT